ncbi:hypothetical protein CBR_g20413 [Chara braunii]|uniref:Reverse transcriptase domain-containing protein n=1 Tax=Chara braunii TaxID=69332 RepID=A0A388JUJ1_CHABU|nr:hypothetical protein CBR_g20413 [Chara braunii]|eukprot:GBG61382.1 hypothetical protein CBR_g20413 [Chara braunii]
MEESQRERSGGITEGSQEMYSGQRDREQQVSGHHGREGVTGQVRRFGSDADGPESRRDTGDVSVLYSEAMMEAFVTNPGYEVITSKEVNVKQDLQTTFKDKDYYVGKGRHSIRVNTRGRGCSFGKTTGMDHWRELRLEDIRSFVEVDLKHTYVSATGVLLRQTIGIPMGKSTSPPLACIMCAYSEYKFLNSLGRRRNQVHGLRLMDDVSIIIERRKKGAGVDDLIQAFESCYPANLKLKHTDDGSGKWEFLGLEMKSQNSYPYLGCIQMSKNEKVVWEQRDLEFKNGQSYLSWGAKQQKSEVIASHLHRIDANTSIRTEIP